MSAEGRVENQKLNQTTADWVFGFQLDLLENKVSHLTGETVHVSPTFQVTSRRFGFDEIKWNIVRPQITYDMLQDHTQKSENRLSYSDFGFR